MILIKIFKCVIHKQSTKILKTVYQKTKFNKYYNTSNKIKYNTPYKEQLSSLKLYTSIKKYYNNK